MKNTLSQESCVKSLDRTIKKLKDLPALLSVMPFNDALWKMYDRILDILKGKVLVVLSLSVLVHVSAAHKKVYITIGTMF